MTNKELPQFIDISLPDSLKIGDKVHISFKDQTFVFTIVEDPRSATIQPLLKYLMAFTNDK